MTETQTTVPVTVAVTHQIPEERIKDLLCNAIEGGSNYWVSTIDRMGGIHRDVAVYRQDVPFVVGGWLRLIEHEPGMPEGAKTNAVRYADVLDGKPYECYQIDRETIVRGLQIFAEKYPQQFADFISENDDAETGDTFLQCICFGDAIYG